MKARTKKEKAVVKIVSKLKPVKFDVFKTLSNQGYATKTKINCLICGGSFKEGNVCPHCNNKLKITKTRKRKFFEFKYYEVIDKKDDYQIIRIFYCKQDCYVGKKREVLIEEVVNWVINPNNEMYVMAIATSSFFYEWRWVHGTEMEIRNKKSDKYSISGFYKRKPNWCERFKYCAYTNKLIVPANWYLKTYIKYPELERVVKAKQLPLASALISGGYRGLSFEDHKKEIILAIRNKCIITDTTVWKDYIYNLRELGIDTTDPKRILLTGEDLQNAHEEAIRQIQRKRDAEWLAQKEKEKIQKGKLALAFQERMKKYENIKLKNGNLIIVPISNVEQLKKESDLLRHCAYTNDYYTKENSLLLSARENKTVIETIEVDLKNKRIIQARGLRNQPSKYNKEIIALVEENLRALVNA